MRMRTVAGLLLFAGWIGVLAHTSAATRCPARALGPCAQVHALMLRARPPLALRLAAAPMKSTAQLPLRIAALPR